MNEKKLNPELQKIFDEYENYFWNGLCDCQDSEIKDAIEIFRDALVEVNEIMKVKQKQVSEEEIKNLRMNNIGDEISLFKAICGKREALNDN